MAAAAAAAAITCSALLFRHPGLGLPVQSSENAGAVQHGRPCLFHHSQEEVMKLADGLTPPPHLPELLLCRDVQVLLLQVLVLELVLQCCRITGI